MSDTRENVNGWLFPADVAPGEDHPSWTRASRGDSEFYIAGRDLLVEVAHRAGVESIDVEPAGGGTGVDGMAYFAVKATVVFDGEAYAAIGSTDQTTNDLEDMASTAETRATKRAIKAALNISQPGMSREDPDAAGETSASGGEVRRGPDGPEIDPPDEYKDEGDGGGEQPEPATGDDGFEF